MFNYSFFPYSSSLNDSVNAVMSWIPIFGSWFIFFGLLCFFFWKLSIFIVSGIIGVIIFIVLSYSMIVGQRSYGSAFWLFILSEALIFGTLFVCCLWSEEASSGHNSLSPAIELPLLGCFILIGSSVLVTAYHHYLGKGISFWLLLLTVVLGFCFILMQLFEFFDCGADVIDCFYYSCCFCTVGLHFSHVLIGLVALMVCLILGEEVLGCYYVTLCVWYWHFVDYIWLFVYVVVYMA